MEIRNITDQAQDIDLPGGGVSVEPGDTVEVPDEIAKGEAPRGEPTDPDYWPGSTGLIGTGKWEQVTKGRKAATAGDGDDQEEV